MNKRKSSLIKFKDFASLLDDEELTELLRFNVSNEKMCNLLSAFKTPMDDCNQLNDDKYGGMN